MAQALRTKHDFTLEETTTRRLQDKTYGLGYWAARDYENRRRTQRAKAAGGHIDHNKEQAQLARQQMIDAGIIKPVAIPVVTEESAE